MRTHTLGFLAVMVVGASFAVAGSSVGRADAGMAVGGGKIAFLRGGVILVVNADGSGVRRLTPHGWDAGQAAWSPDGRKIAFVRRHPDAKETRDARDELYVVRADGRRMVRLTRNRVSDDSPTWSPDGRMIAFVREQPRALDTDIFVMNANGSGLRQLTNAAGLDEMPNWSPDGHRIAFVYSDYPVNPAIWVMEARGKNRQQLTHVKNATDAAPEWSPDGKRIAFARAFYSDPAAPAVISTMNADGSDQRPLARRIETGGAVWSPSGRWLAFGSYVRPAFDWAIDRVNPDGSGLRRLAAKASGFSWSPDEATIVFARSEDNNLYVMNADGSGKKRLTRFQERDYDPVYNPIWQPAF